MILSKSLQIKLLMNILRLRRKELQLLFLENLSQDVGLIFKFFEAVSNIEFSAKQDFMKGLVQNPFHKLNNNWNSKKQTKG